MLGIEIHSLGVWGAGDFGVNGAVEVYANSILTRIYNLLPEFLLEKEAGIAVGCWAVEVLWRKICSLVTDGAAAGGLIKAFIGGCEEFLGQFLSIFLIR